MSTYERPLQLGGPGRLVEVDEVLLRHVHVPGKKQNEAVIVLGMACEGKVLTGIVPDRKRQTLHSNILKVVRPGSTIVTDDWCAYKGLERLGFDHISINHSCGFFNQDGYSTCEIDAYWASLRRAMRGYHQVSPSNLWKFLAEVECRYNFRRERRALFDSLTSRWPTLTLQSAAMFERRFDWRLGDSNQ